MNFETNTPYFIPGWSRYGSELLIDSEHALSAVNRTVQWLESWVQGSGGILVQVLVGGIVLVKVDDNTTLPLAAQPVYVRELHAIRDTERRSFDVATDQRRTVALLTEALEKTVDDRSSLHNVVFNPGNSCLPVLATHSKPTWVFGTCSAMTVRAGVCRIRSGVGGIGGFVLLVVNGAVVTGVVARCWRRAGGRFENVFRATVWEP